MKPAPFKFLAAASLGEALAMKARYGDEASFLAGGQSLIPTLNFRLARPAALIDLNRISELAGIAHDDKVIRIGAMTRYRALERDRTLGDAVPLMREALPHIAHPQIRNRGTLGGNLSHADPSSEMPAIVLALGGRLRAQSVRGERWIAARDFFIGTLTTALAVDEMLTEIELPKLPPRTGACFMEVARRRGDFAMMGVAATVTLGDDGRCTAARLALCGAGETPIDASAAVAVMIGQHDLPLGDVAAAVRAAITPSGNIHASAGFQQHLAGVLVQRAIRTAAGRAHV